MRRIVTALALLLAACGGAPSATGPAAPAETVSRQPAWDTDVDVTVLSSVGDLPPAERRIEIAVDAAGVLTVDGEPCDLDGLRTALKARAGNVEGTHAADLDALLVLDRALPWRVAQLCMQECAITMVGRIFFAVRHEPGGAPGAFAVFLPRDVGMPRPRLDVPKIVARVRADGDGPDSDPWAFCAVVEDATERIGAAPRVEIDAADSTRVDLALRLADAAACGGASFLTVVGAPGHVGAGGLPAEVERLTSGPRAAHVTASGKPLPDVAAAPAARARIVGGYAGFTVVAADLGMQELEEEPLQEIEEPDER